MSGNCRLRRLGARVGILQNECAHLISNVAKKMDPAQIEGQSGAGTRRV